MFIVINWIKKGNQEYQPLLLNLISTINEEKLSEEKEKGKIVGELFKLINKFLFGAARESKGV